MWSKYVLKYMVPKPKAYSSKKYQKLMASFLKKLSLLIKSIKSEGQMKSFQSNVSTLMGGGGHICLFLQVR